jgi:hypothetical protein
MCADSRYPFLVSYNFFSDKRLKLSICTLIYVFLCLHLYLLYLLNFIKGNLLLPFFFKKLWNQNLRNTKNAQTHLFIEKTLAMEKKMVTVPILRISLNFLKQTMAKPNRFTVQSQPTYTFLFLFDRETHIYNFFRHKNHHAYWYWWTCTNPTAHRTHCKRPV